MNNEQCIMQFSSTASAVL